MNAITEINQAETLNQSLDSLRERYNQQPCLPIEARINNLKLIKQSLIEHRTQLIEALSNDFGCRTEFDTSIADIMPTVTQINYTLKHLKQWMKPSKRSAGLMFMPSKVAVKYQHSVWSVS
ncbi:aldehyde dehydrogenase [Vibrio astriarenae]|nr:aldehyde dehydrogenase [Vibrio sp. C7]